ncbi:MAG TPA: hypothetical protein P5121_18475 [Caldilineaceae bacterium]|nr:hypothetical protein [Caldilineaceae bacterium]
MLYTIWLLIGILLATFFLWVARSRGLQREPMILALGLIVAAIIYVGFALVWGNTQWVAIEIGGLLLYTVFVLLAQRHNLVWLAVGWAVHPLWDIGLHWLGQGHTVAPEWYIFACLSFDLVVAGYMVTRLNRWKPNASRIYRRSEKDPCS